jgi:hypothetical protein
MAMKIRFLVATAAVGVAAGFLLLHRVGWIQIHPTVGGAALAAPSLPDDERLAERELRKVRHRLNALRSSRPYIVVDTNSGLLYLRSEDSIMLKTPCSTGSGGEVVDEATGRRWAFDTPLGVFRVETKLVDPWWRKPDWAFIEDGLDVPADPGERLDPEMLGQYALGFGDGYYIHGTVYERLLGISVTHGCIRVGSDDLERLYEKVGIGTRIYIF